MPNDFRATTLGLGDLYIDGVHVGFLKETVEFVREVERLDFEAGIPQTFQGTVITKEIVRLTASLAQISISALSLVSGTIPVTTNSGGAGAVVDNDNFYRTLAPLRPGGDIEYVDLNHTNITNLVVKDMDAAVTYTAEDDYFLDAEYGILYRNPAGDMTSGQQLNFISFDYNDAASTQINFGVDYVFQDHSLEFVHVSPVSGDTISCFMPKCQGGGTITMSFQEGAYMLLPVEFKAFPDTANYPNSPLGWCRRTPAA